MTKQKEQKGISGSALKIIAIISMLIDHIGAVFLGSYYTPYYICRLIGRIAFPIFCFLLVEGFFHTRNLSKYCLRLALFAAISEIPFDFTFRQTAFDPSYQNVFFTLLIGLMTISAMEYIQNQFPHKYGLKLICTAAILFSGALSAWYLKTDYGEIGVLCIVIFYLYHKRKSIAAALACFCLLFSSTLELPAFVSVPLIKFYNGTRGISLKYVFYLFYPIHLLILSYVYWHI